MVLRFAANATAVTMAAIPSLEVQKKATEIQKSGMQVSSGNNQKGYLQNASAKDILVRNGNIHADSCSLP